MQVETEQGRCQCRGEVGRVCIGSNIVKVAKVVKVRSRYSPQEYVRICLGEGLAVWQRTK